MPKLFVYRIVSDIGAAPNLLDGLLTLTLCKPGIRRSAQVGDYVLALVALQHAQLTGKGSDRYYKAAYLFAIREKIGILDYKAWCNVHAPSKICVPNSASWGNCQYENTGDQRDGGPHGPLNKNRDLGGRFSLVSDHYAAWTSMAPHTLRDSELDNIGLDKTQIQTATRNFFAIPLDRPEQIAALERLIAENQPVPATAAPCSGASCKKRAAGGTRRQQRSKRGTRRRT